MTTQKHMNNEGNRDEDDKHEEDKSGTGRLVQSVRTISVWTVLGVRFPHGEY